MNLTRKELEVEAREWEDHIYSCRPVTKYFVSTDGAVKVISEDENDDGIVDRQPANYTIKYTNGLEALKHIGYTTQGGVLCDVEVYYNSFVYTKDDYENDFGKEN